MKYTIQSTHGILLSYPFCVIVSPFLFVNIYQHSATSTIDSESLYNISASIMSKYNHLLQIYSIIILSELHIIFKLSVIAIISQCKNAKMYYIRLYQFISLITHNKKLLHPFTGFLTSIIRYNNV